MESKMGFFLVFKEEVVSGFFLGWLSSGSSLFLLGLGFFSWSSGSSVGFFEILILSFGSLSFGVEMFLFLSEGLDLNGLEGVDLSNEKWGYWLCWVFFVFIFGLSYLSLDLSLLFGVLGVFFVFVYVSNNDFLFYFSIKDIFIVSCFYFFFFFVFCMLFILFCFLYNFFFFF